MSLPAGKPMYVAERMAVGTYESLRGRGAGVVLEVIDVEGREFRFALTPKLARLLAENITRAERIARGRDERTVA